MNTIRHLLILAATLATAQLAPAAVPSAINYQGRLSNASGTSQQGNRAMSVKLYDADTGGTLLYSENLGNVAVDANGVYAFQFGASGTSDTLVTETLATTDGTALTYQKSLSHTPVLPGSLSVTDGTFSWNETTGNPGSLAHATANVMFGFVVGATVTNGGSGYTAPPVVTITGNGMGAAATAAVAGGVVTEITITNAGSGYTTGASITLAPPPAPFVVNYTGGTVTVTYTPAPPAGRSITATYRYSTAGISGALAAGAEQWLELTVDGVAQSPRQRVLAVPFAMNALTSQVASESTGLLSKQLNDLGTDLALLAAGMSVNTMFSEKFATSKINVLTGETTLLDDGQAYAPILRTSNGDINNLSVRGAFVNCISGYAASGYTLTITYSDNEISTIPGGYISGNGPPKYVPNPNPEKLVKNVSFSCYPNNWSAPMSIIINAPGVLAISIPSTIVKKSQIGLFLTTTMVNIGDVIMARVVGTSGSQSIKVNDYTPISVSVGVPQKILVTFTPTNVNLQQYSSISGYAVRFAN